MRFTNNKYYIIKVFIALSVMSLGVHAQNIGINTTGGSPNASAILDLNTWNTFTSPNGKGLLIPNVSLSSTGDQVTCGCLPAAYLYLTPMPV